MESYNFSSSCSMLDSPQLCFSFLPTTGVRGFVLFLMFLWKDQSSSWLNCRMFFFFFLHEATHIKSNSQSYSQTVNPQTWLYWPDHLPFISRQLMIPLVYSVSVCFTTNLPCHTEAQPLVNSSLSTRFIVFLIAHPCILLSNFHLISKVSEMEYFVKKLPFCSHFCFNTLQDGMVLGTCLISTSHEHKCSRFFFEQQRQNSWFPITVNRTLPRMLCLCLTPYWSCIARHHICLCRCLTSRDLWVQPFILQHRVAYEYKWIQQRHSWYMLASMCWCSPPSVASWR